MNLQSFVVRPLIASLLAIGGIGLASAAPALAQEGCTGAVCGLDNNESVKAKRKGGYQEGRSPQERRQYSEAMADAADYYTGPVFDPDSQDYEPNPAIWKLADADTTIYMFGTFHILPDGFRWRSDAFNAVVKEVDELVVETSDDDSEEALGDFMSEMFANILNEESPSVSDRLSAEARPKWAKLAELSGMPLEVFDRMPLFLSLMGAGLSISEQMGSSASNGVETVLEAEFKLSERPIGSIEDSSAVMASLLGIDEGGMIKELETDLANWDGESLESLFGMGIVGGEELEDPEEIRPFDSEHKWAQGNLEDLDTDAFGDSEVGKKIYQVLLTDRNRAWAEWLDNRLDQPGTILLAVGAAHFEGPDSVQEMLKKRELEAERIH